jgi:hypothetical protein
MPKHSALFAILPILFLKTSAYAQTPDASPELTIWDHNGSVMYLVANGSSREFYYEKPRPGMLEAGARPGSLLFRGEVNDGQYSGTAYIFNPRCGKIPFQVKGTILDNDERIVLTGQAPRLRRNCQTYAAYTSNLEFKLLKSIAASPPPEPQGSDGEETIIIRRGRERNGASRRREQRRRCASTCSTKKTAVVSGNLPPFPPSANSPVTKDC